MELIALTDEKKSKSDHHEDFMKVVALESAWESKPISETVLKNPEHTDIIHSIAEQNKY